MERLDLAFQRMQRDTLHGAFWWGVLAAAFATLLVLSFVRAHAIKPIGRCKLDSK